MGVARAAQLVLLTTLAACGADVTVIETLAPNTFRSGERLHAMVVADGAGAKRFYNWYDTELDTLCMIQEELDGSARCKPLTYGFVKVMYADASCTQPVVVSQGCSGAAYGHANGIYYRAGAKFAASTLFDLGDDGQCLESGTRFDDVYERELVPDEDFVEFTRTEVPVTDALSVVRLEASDGAMQNVRFHNGPRDTRCVVADFAVADGSQWPCIASDAVMKPDAFFADAGCMVPAAAGGASPEVVLEYNDTCGRIAAVRSVGDPVGVAYDGTLGCQSVTDSTYSFYLPGDPVQNSEAVPLVVAADLGTGRLRSEHYGAEAATPLLDRDDLQIDGTYNHNYGGSSRRRPLFDTELATRCSPWAFESEPTTTRCIPEVIERSVIEFFADAQCTTPLVNVAPDTCDYRTHDYMALWSNEVAGDAPGCAIPTVAEVRRLEERYEGPVYHQFFDSDPCRPFTFDPGPFYTLSDALPPDTFAPMTLELDAQ